VVRAHKQRVLRCLFLKVRVFPDSEHIADRAAFRVCAGTGPVYPTLWASRLVARATCPWFRVSDFGPNASTRFDVGYDTARGPVMNQSAAHPKKQATAVKT
jgi:hypothetical protein